MDRTKMQHIWNGFPFVPRHSLGRTAAVPIKKGFRQEFCFISVFNLQILMSINVREMDMEFYF
jgi:hypothetical protein